MKSIKMLIDSINTHGFQVYRSTSKYSFLNLIFITKKTQKSTKKSR